ncbi:hypothetical protein HMPREF1146_1517 [Prevotella sp. MSX73]|nr:hypothetical protein HMPREF1146_1517 [Prevotella sp. MSX73]
MGKRSRKAEKVIPISRLAPSSLQKGYTWRLKGPQLRVNCGPFASPKSPFQTGFRAL